MLRSLRRVATGTWILLLSIAIGLVATSVADAAFPGTNGRIMFSESGLDATSPAGGGKVKLSDQRG